MNCRICKSNNYKSVLNLGSIYPSNFVSDSPNIEPKPLHLVQCNNCNLVQLEETFDLDVMYKEHYWYRSGLNSGMVNSLKEIVDQIKLRKPECEIKQVLDIGCNDGTLLSFYGDNVWKVGVDPSKNVKESASKICNYFINDYFGAESLRVFHCGKIHRYYKFDVITSIAMFYDLENPNQFVSDIKKVLDVGGIWVIQFTDLLSMLKCNAFDNACHEHLEYYTLDVLHNLLLSHGLEIFDVEYNNVNGGSVRVYVRHLNSARFEATDKLKDALEYEYIYLTKHPIEEFSNKILQEKSTLLKLISDIKNSNETIYVLGASTKGNTLLQHYGLTSDTIDKALEVNKDKFGLKTIGTNIPIIDEEIGIKEKPDYLLVLPWFYRDFFINKFKDYIMAGGKIIFPLPSVTVIDKRHFE